MMIVNVNFSDIMAFIIVLGFVAILIFTIACEWLQDKMKGGNSNGEDCRK